ncbi:MAG: ribonuclease HII [Pyrobaculum sp.]
MVGGIDEAGRGSLVGPLVIAVVVGDGEQLGRLGVRDSKLLTPRARELLFYKIVNMAECINYVVIEPHIIDSYKSLNLLELVFSVELIRKCVADIYYVDSPDVNPARYGELLSAMSGVRVVALNRGERIPQVAAASIVAKVIRDKTIEFLKREVGDFGSGYPSDRRTKEKVLRGLLPPECVRQSWKISR